MTSLALSLPPTAVAALLDMPERQVRKESEHGILSQTTPPRLDFAALVYLRVLGLLGVELGVEGRRQLYRLLVHAAAQRPVPETIEWLPLLTLKLGPVVREVESRVEPFLRWKSTLVSDPNILGGEPVFPGRRLAVRRIGALVDRGESPEAIRADYPDLSDDDLRFARIYTQAYPKVGRPRGRGEATSR